ncbi:unnamed protein product, partial [Porites lobata]
KQEPPQEQPLTGTVTLNKFSGDTYLREYLPEKILTKPPGREGGKGARIRKKANIDPLRSARIRNDSQEGYKLMICYDQQAKLQCKATLTKGHTRSPAIPQSAMIRKKATNDPLRSASKATMQSNTSKRAHKEPCNSLRAAP